MRNSFGMIERFLLLTLTLLLWACGDPPLDYVDLEAVDQAAEKAKQDSIKACEDEVAKLDALYGRITFTDDRDGHVYKQVTIGSQTWMAENLNYETADSYCYDNSPANCDLYGRLYTWQAAMAACPSGWHLPTESEFEILFTVAPASNQLQSTYGWDEITIGATGEIVSNGTDDFGFSALPAGQCGVQGVTFCGEYGGEYEPYGFKGYAAWFWTSTETSFNFERAEHVIIASHVSNNSTWDMAKHMGSSVRCIMD